MNTQGKFKLGDSVRRKSPRAKAAKIVGEYGKGWYDISYPSTDKRYRIHQRFLELVVKPEPKQDRSELYKLLPRVKEWKGKYFATDQSGSSWFFKQKPDRQDDSWDNEHYTMRCIDYPDKIKLPKGISWKDTLVSREEMEAWEKSQDPESYEIDWSKLDQKATCHVFNEDGSGYYYKSTNFQSLSPKTNGCWIGSAAWFNSPLTLPPGADWKKSLRVNPKLVEQSQVDQIQFTPQTETPQAKVERLKSELKEAEAELEKTIPVQICDVSVYVSDHDVFAYNHNEYRVVQSVGNNLTSLQFFKK